jgi:large subunit ribosomal protein L4
VLDQLAISEPKTKEMVSILNNLKVEKKALVVTSEVDVNVFKSVRNIPGIKPAQASDLNV